MNQTKRTETETLRCFQCDGCRAFYHAKDKEGMPIPEAQAKHPCTNPVRMTFTYPMRKE